MIVWWKIFKAIGLVVCLLGLTKNWKWALVMIFLKLVTSYSYSINCSPFCQSYSDLKILQNSPLLIKAGKNFAAIAFSVGVFLARYGINVTPY